MKESDGIGPALGLHRILVHVNVPHHVRLFETPPGYKMIPTGNDRMRGQWKEYEVRVTTRGPRGRTGETVVQHVAGPGKV